MDAERLRIARELVAAMKADVSAYVFPGGSSIRVGQPVAMLVLIQGAPLDFSGIVVDEARRLRPAWVSRGWGLVELITGSPHVSITVSRFAKLCGAVEYPIPKRRHWKWVVSVPCGRAMGYAASPSAAKRRAMRAFRRLM